MTAMTIMYITLYNVLNDPIFKFSKLSSCFFAPCPAAPPRHSHDDSDLLVMVKVPKSPSDDSSTQVPEAKVFSPTGNIQIQIYPTGKKKHISPTFWHFFESMILRQTCRFGGIWHSFPGGYIICIRVYI